MIPALAGLLDDAVDGGFRGGVDQQDVDFLEDQFADLAVLLRDRPVAVHHDVVCDLAVALACFAAASNASTI